MTKVNKYSEFYVGSDFYRLTGLRTQRPQDDEAVSTPCYAPKLAPRVLRQQEK